MAVGDVIADYFVAATDFQPAAGVEIMITTLLGINTSARIIGKGDIASVSNLKFGGVNATDEVTVTKWEGFKFKFPISNSAYLNFTQCGFSGIQIK